MKEIILQIAFYGGIAYFFGAEVSLVILIAVMIAFG